MNKLLLLTLLAGIFSFASLDYSEDSYFVVSSISGEPDLPSFPFDYSVVLPEHFRAPDPGNNGYEIGDINNDDLPLIERNVATLGRVLFYDTKLSAQENISCASCHLQELSFADNVAKSDGVESPTLRNSMHLNDLGWTNNDLFSWDMEHKSLRDMIVLPLTDKNEIGATITEMIVKLENTSYYPNLFSKAFGSTTVTEQRVVDALGQFIESINSFNSKFDQAANEDFVSFTEQELEGQNLFSDNCTICHSQGSSVLFDGLPEDQILHGFPQMFKNGLPQVGDDMGASEWIEGEEYDGAFKLTSLRNIELTAPYMHDGRFNSLEEVMEFYSEKSEGSFIIPAGGYDFSEEEQNALVAFLKTLTDNSMATNEKWSDPFPAAVGVEDELISELKIYPNPMVESVTISFENEGSNLTSLNVYDALGSLVRHENTSSTQMVLDKADFQPGQYLIQVIQGDRKSTRRLLVQ